MSVSAPGAADRLRQVGRLVAAGGPEEVVWRLRARAARRLLPLGRDRLPIGEAEVAAAAEAARLGWAQPPPLPLAEGAPMTIGWVCVPPAQGSGGHTTLFRLVELLEQEGHRCVIYLKDRHGWSIDQHRATIRRHWPAIGAEVRELAAGVEDAHALVATGWDTAYSLLREPARGVRFYLVQDYEPAFYPAGSEYLLAEATYRFGFHGLTAGPWLADVLRREHGMAADHFDLGCDLETYRRDPVAGQEPRRDGVAYYCRPDTPRRGHALAVQALSLFARRHPGTPLHLYGTRVSGLPFDAVQHGLLRPDELATLYASCVAGLALSATNISLVPWEMLASGCIPVVNDSDGNRRVLDNPFVAYAPGTPHDLADALSALVTDPPSRREERALAAAGSVTGASWATAGAQVEEVVRRVVASRQEKP